MVKGCSAKMAELKNLAAAKCTRTWANYEVILVGWNTDRAFKDQKVRNLKTIFQGSSTAI